MSSSPQPDYFFQFNKICLDNEIDLDIIEKLKNGVDGPLHVCRLCIDEYELTTSGSGASKEDAKNQAAKKLLPRLKAELKKKSLSPPSPAESSASESNMSRSSTVFSAASTLQSYPGLVDELTKGVMAALLQSHPALSAVLSSDNPDPGCPAANSSNSVFSAQQQVTASPLLGASATRSSTAPQDQGPCATTHLNYPPVSIIVEPVKTPSTKTVQAKKENDSPPPVPPIPNVPRSATACVSESGSEEVTKINQSVAPVTGKGPILNVLAAVDNARQKYTKTSGPEFSRRADNVARPYASSQPKNSKGLEENKASGDNFSKKGTKTYYKKNTGYKNGFKSQGPPHRPASRCSTDSAMATNAAKFRPPPQPLKSTDTHCSREDLRPLPDILDEAVSEEMSKEVPKEKPTSFTRPENSAHTTKPDHAASKFKPIEKPNVAHQSTQDDTPHKPLYKPRPKPQDSASTGPSVASDNAYRPGNQSNGLTNGDNSSKHLDSNATANQELLIENVLQALSELEKAFPSLCGLCFATDEQPGNKLKKFQHMIQNRGFSVESSQLPGPNLFKTVLMIKYHNAPYFAAVGDSRMSQADADDEAVNNSIKSIFATKLVPRN